jgi:hypothetical protein
VSESHHSREIVETFSSLAGCVHDGNTLTKGKKTSMERLHFANDKLSAQATSAGRS